MITQNRDTSMPGIQMEKKAYKNNAKNERVLETLVVTAFGINSGYVS